MAERASWRPRWYLWAALGLALLWLIRGQAPWPLQGRRLLVGAIALPALLIAPVVFAGRRERNMLLATLVGLGGYLGLTACFEAIGPHALVVPRYIWDVDAAAATGQARGPFSQAVTEGFACYACGVAAVIARSVLRRRRPPPHAPAGGGESPFPRPVRP